MSDLKKQAEEWAAKCIHERGNPHRNDLRDAFLAGARAQSTEIKRLRTDLDACRKERDQARLALDQSDGFVQIASPENKEPRS